MTYHTEEFFVSLAEQAETEPIYYNVEFPPSTYYRFFRLLTAALKPALSVELGVDGCGGTLHLALGNPDGLVIGVDVNQIDKQSHPLYHRYRHVVDTCPNVRFLFRCDSIEAVDIVARDYPDKLVDILFIDTVHTYERTMAEFFA